MCAKGDIIYNGREIRVCVCVCVYVCVRVYADRRYVAVALTRSCILCTVREGEEVQVQ